jgi:cytoskeletal protein RodZ
MTNQNPASSQPQSPKIDSDILAKINAHADRSLDRLFVDIDELLNDDLPPDVYYPQQDRSALTQSNYAIEPFRAEDDIQIQQPQAYPPQSLDTADPKDRPTRKSKSKPRKQSGIPLWLKALLGIGVTSIALSSLLFWLVNQRKIALPQNIDTSWLPFQSQSQISPADAKFAEYMRKSIAKVESSSNLTTSTTIDPNPATITTSTVAPSTNSASAIATTPIAVTPNLTTKPIALIKTLISKDRLSAVLQIDKKSQTINVGQKIGTTNWSLINVSKNEITIKRKGGEIRSIKIGQKF